MVSIAFLHHSPLFGYSWVGQNKFLQSIRHGTSNPFETDGGAGDNSASSGYRLRVADWQKAQMLCVWAIRLLFQVVLWEEVIPI